MSMSVIQIEKAVFAKRAALGGFVAKIHRGAARRRLVDVGLERRGAHRRECRVARERFERGDFGARAAAEPPRLLEHADARATVGTEAVQHVVVAARGDDAGRPRDDALVAERAIDSRADALIEFAIEQPLESAAHDEKIRTRIDAIAGARKRRALRAAIADAHAA